MAAVTEAAWTMHKHMWRSSQLGTVKRIVKNLLSDHGEHSALQVVRFMTRKRVVCRKSRSLLHNLVMFCRTQQATTAVHKGDSGQHDQMLQAKSANHM